MKLLFVLVIGLYAPTPLPKTREITVNELVGTYTMSSNEHRGTFILRSDYSYECNYRSSCYAGTWKYEAGNVHIKERLINSVDAFSGEWKFIPSRKDGVIMGEWCNERIKQLR